MKYICKTEYYESPKVGQGTFKNPYAETTTPKKEIINGQTYLSINFDLKYIQNGQEIVLEEDRPVQFGEAQPTMILNENNEEVDVRDFLASGGTYSIEKIVHWGRPSAEQMENEYLDPSTLWTANIQLTQDEPQRQIAKDWIDANVLIQSQAINVNFELEEI